MKNIIFLICIALLVVCETAATTKSDEISMLMPEVMKKDLDFLLKNIDEIHPNMYAYISKEEFNKLKNNAYGKLNEPLNDLEYYRIIAPLVAEIRNGHTSIWLNEKATSLLKSQITTSYPIEIGCYRDGVFVEGYYGLRDLPTGEILEINNQNAFDYLKELCRYSAVEYKNYNFSMLERAGLAALIWLDGGEIKTVNLKVKSEQGEIHNLTIDAVEIPEIKKAILVRKSEKKHEQFEFKHDKENNAAIITIRDFHSDSLEIFKTFLKKYFSYIHEKNIKNLIVDIRDNPGGSTNVSQELVSYLTDKPFKLFSKVSTKLSKQIEGKLWRKVKKKDVGKIMEYNSSDIIPNKSYQKFSGQTYLLINGNTFSTALDLAVVLQYYHLATLVGDETKDTPSGYGEVIMLESPETKMKLAVSVKYFEALGDKKDGRGVVPDYEIRQRGKDTAKGVDTVLQFTFDLIKKSPYQIQ